MAGGAESEPGAKYNAISQAEGWAGVCDPSLAFRRPELVSLLAIWRETAIGAAAPKRSDMKATLLRAHLQHVAIYERVATNETRRYRVRLMGTQFAQVMGDLTGQFLDEAVPEFYVPRWNMALDTVLECAVPLRFVSRSDTANKSFLVGEFLEAPLLGESGEMNMVLAAGIFTPAEDWQGFLNLA